MQSIRREQNLNIPNMLTALRIALLPFVAWRFLRGDLRGALLIYLAAMLTDVLDGLIARKMNQITSLGKLLDPLADKLSLFTLLWLFASTGQISVLLLQLVLVKELILIIGSVAALRAGIVVSALPVGKATTLIFTVSVLFRFLAYYKVADYLLGFSILLSFLALLWYSILLIQKTHTMSVTL